MQTYYYSQCSAFQLIYNLRSVYIGGCSPIEKWHHSKKKNKKFSVFFFLRRPFLGFFQAIVIKMLYAPPPNFNKKLPYHYELE